jgi:hypothetical protein
MRIGAAKGVFFGRKEHVMAEHVRPPGNNAYFARRETQERSLAAQAVDRAVRCAHLSMAERYAALARETVIVAHIGV